MRKAEFRRRVLLRFFSDVNIIQQLTILKDGNTLQKRQMQEIGIFSICEVKIAIKKMF